MKTNEKIYYENYMKLPNSCKEDWDYAIAAEPDMHKAILESMDSFAMQEAIEVLKELNKKYPFMHLAKAEGINTEEDLYKNLRKTK